MNPSPTTKKIPLVEKFGPTIQGEGATIGLQTYFLRFGLCDYRCIMCDSMHAVDPIQVKAHAKWMTQQEIADLFPDLHQTWAGCDWITFSGGNPCIHDLTHLVELLQAKGYKITVETQGTLCPQWLQQCDQVTVSPKGPGMGEIFEPDKFRHFIRFLYGQSFNCKVVIFTQNDLDFADSVLEIWINEEYTKNSFYLSQGNPFPPGKSQPVGRDLHINLLRDEYLTILALIQKTPRLCRVKYLPQWHVWLWSNQQGV